MRDICVRQRPDGVTELSPKLAPLDREDRGLIIFTVLISCMGFFMAGALPAPALGAIVGTCVAGEVVLGARAVLLALLRTPAEVHEIPPRPLRRRATLTLGVPVTAPAAPRSAAGRPETAPPAGEDLAASPHPPPT